MLFRSLIEDKDLLEDGDLTEEGLVEYVITKTADDPDAASPEEIARFLWRLIFYLIKKSQEE